MKRGEKMEHSIKAGLMITSASDYNMEICRGANEACKELGIELVIFFGGSVDPNVEFVQSSDYQKANVYVFADYLDLDFLVIPASSICRTDQKTREAFPKYFHTPVVTLNSQIKDYPFVVYNLRKKNLFMTCLRCLLYFFLNKNQFIIRKNKNKSDYIVEKQKKTAFDSVF